ncbi:ParB-like chromosome segregation protein Spo0J [Ochrobactrum sp. P20RRXII]|nr:ParB N-terminal domain-containing protein [Ochrobactrum sp. P20RRXII]NIH77411.1 ParB-like chromosome segregation protein Spo0J [Ochrobactrum sp. P20RRXII]
MIHTVELWDVEKLVPYELNAKKHPDFQIEKLARSIKKFGFSSPIVVWGNGEIIAGHGRRLASIKLGLTKVPVVVRADLSKAEADAMRLADNRVASTEYDQEMVQEELRRLNELIMTEDIDLDLSLTGYDEKELNFTLADMGEMSFDHFVDDVGAALEEQKQETAKVIADTDDTAAPVVDALGFKRLPIAQSRQLREFMRQIETQTGLKGADALMQFLTASLA